MIDVEFTGKNTDGTRECSRRRKNFVSAGSNIIATACSYVAHRSDDGFGLRKLTKFAENNVAAHGTSARTIDTQHNSAHAVVSPNPLECFDHGFATGQNITGQRCLARAAVNNDAIDINHCDTWAFSPAGFWIFVALVAVFKVAGNTILFAQLRFNFVNIDELIDEMFLNGLVAEDWNALKKLCDPRWL